MAERTLVEFDLDRYLRNSKKVDLSGIAWEEVANHPLSDGDVLCLHYMMDIEAHTVIYLRDLRVRVGIGNGFGLVPAMVGSMLARDFVAIHMMWGTVNELTTLTGYYALIRRSQHPVLHQLLRKVIQDERRHFAFYRAQAKARMGRSPVARKVVRWALQTLWAPVGAGVKSEEEVDALALYLFGDSPEGREQVRGIDQTIAAVPGLEGLTLLEDYLDAAGHRARERPGWAGMTTAPRAPASDGAPPAPAHWRGSAEARPDVMPATSEIERREEARMTARLEALATAGSGAASNGHGD
jgi:hypothetical protein